MVGARTNRERKRNSFSLSDIEWRPFSPNASDDTDKKTCCHWLAERFHVFRITIGHGKRILLWRSCETLLMPSHFHFAVWAEFLGSNFFHRNWLKRADPTLYHVVTFTLCHRISFSGRRERMLFKICNFPPICWNVAA